MKIYVVTDGCYSDYRIIALYTKEADAEALKSALSGDAEVAEWETDVVPIGPPGMKLWTVYENLAEFVVWSETPTGGEVIGKWEHSEDCKSNIRVWATDEQHAVKIANELRAQAKAFNQWPK